MSTTNPPLCWICSTNPADSREHKFKVSDLRRSFGRGRWTGASRPVHGVDGGIAKDMQGPKQLSLTFGPVICGPCNSARSQPWDQAYDRFVEWVENNRALLLKQRNLDFELMYGNDWEDAQINLFRYFAKHLGCNIARTPGHAVPDDLREVLHQAPFRTALQVTFHVHEDILLAPGLDRGLFLGGLDYYEDTKGEIPGYYSHVIVGWMMTCYWYGLEPTDPLATPWIADARTLNVGAHSPMTNGQRAELMRRAAGLPHRPIFDGEE